jgi:hypothetical protein
LIHGKDVLHGMWNTSLFDLFIYLTVRLLLSCSSRNLKSGLMKRYCTTKRVVVAMVDGGAIILSVSCKDCDSRLGIEEFSASTDRQGKEGLHNFKYVPRLFFNSMHSVQIAAKLE